MMYEEQREKLRGEFPDVMSWSDEAVNRLLHVRNSPAYRQTVAEQREAGRQQQQAQEQERARIKAKLQESATVAAEQLTAHRESMLGAWLRDGGTEAEFNQEWPEIRAGILKDRARQRDAEYERSARSFYRGIF